ncbi:MAG: exopolysaccharide production protein [Pseudomonadota bacterium]|jgi:O-antigen ligase
MSIVYFDAIYAQRRDPRARMFLLPILAIATVGLSLSFRERDLGDTSLDLQNGLKLAFWFGVFAFSLLHIKTIISVSSSRAGIAIFSLGLLALASATWSEKPLYTLACAIGFLSYLGFAAISLHELTEIEFYQTMQSLLFAFVGLGLMGAMFFPDLTWQPPSIEETQFRLQGFAANSNNFGRMAAFLALIGVGSVLRRQTITINIFLSISAGLAGLILSGSRTSFIAAGLAIGVLAFRLLPHRFTVFLSAMAALSIALIFISYGFRFDTLFRSLSRTGLEGEIFTLTGRTDLWAAAWELITERPFFGWGFNGTEERLSMMIGADFYGAPVNPHQMFLHLALGLGLVGVVPALFFISDRLIQFIRKPDLLNDLLFLFILINGMAEIDLFGTPLFTNIIFFRIIMKNNVSSGPMQ